MELSLSPAALAPSCAAAGIRRRRSTSSLALPGLTLLLIATAPQANGSRAKRRHPSPNAGSRDPSAMYGPSLTHCSIPGVSIWTSKEAASRLQRRSSATAAAAAASEEAVVASSTFDCEACVGGWIDAQQAGNAKTVRTRRSRDAQSSGDGACGGDYQVRLVQHSRLDRNVFSLELPTLTSPIKKVPRNAEEEQSSEIYCTL